MIERSVYMHEMVPLMQESLAAGQPVRFSPKGRSMLPMLRQGRDTVTLSPATHPLKRYDIPLYRRDDGSYVLHRIVAVGKTYTCVGDSQFILEKEIRQDQILGVVTAFSRDGRQISVEDPAYRLYVRLLDGTRRVRWFFVRAARKLRRIFQSV